MTDKLLYEGLRILIIDDDREFSHSIEDFLQDRGFLHNYIDDGNLGIEKAVNNECDVVLLDLKMPKMSGIKVIREMKLKAPEIPIIIVSGTIDIKEAVTAVREGADEYILKPIYDMTELELCINRVWEKYLLKRQLEEYKQGLESLVFERTKQLQVKTEELTQSNELLKSEIVKRKHAEILLKKNTMNIIEAIEQERKRLSQELHDSVGQRLMFTKINLELLAKELKQENEKLNNAIEGVSLAGTEISSLIKSLYPVSIEKYSLLQNIKTLIESFEKISMINVEFGVEGNEPQIEKNVKLSIYRIFQEVLNNIAKHSDAQNVRIKMMFQNSELSAEISDDGIGVDFENEENLHSGTGLFSIQERIVQLNGNFNIRSKNGSGFTIEFKVVL